MPLFFCDLCWISTLNIFNNSPEIYLVYSDFAWSFNKSNKKENLLKSYFIFYFLHKDLQDQGEEGMVVLICIMNSISPGIRTI